MKRLDKQIFVFFLLVSLLSILLTNVIFAGGAAQMAIVEVDGREFGRYSLAEKEPKILDVRTEFGYNKIVISDGGVCVTETDCPDKLELAEGEIRTAGQLLVCLPHRLMVRLVGESEVDGVAY